MVGAVDVLVIDEAGQFSLANAVAVAPAARSLVLLGDPQQLTQPTKAVHPYGSGVSALDHLRTTDDGVVPRRHPRRPRGLPRPHPPDAPEPDGVRVPARLRGPPRVGARARAALRRGTGRAVGRRAPLGAGRARASSASSRAARRPWSCAASSTTCCAAAGPRQKGTRGRSGSPTSSSSPPTTPTSRMLAAALPDGRSGRHGRQVPGPTGRGRHLLDGEHDGCARAARCLVPLRPAPSQRRHLAGQGHGRHRRKPAAHRRRGPHARGAARRQRACRYVDEAKTV